VNPPPAAFLSRRPWLGAGVLVALVVLAYLPTLSNGFVWDDDAALTQNPFMASDDGLRQFWLTADTPDYWPVTATTLWVEWRLWGLRPAGYHATNLALHAAEVLLLWAVLRRLRLPGAWLAAALFAVHPVNVETVAWITQRKNLMAMLFFLLSVLAFLRWREEVNAGSPGSTRWYGLSLAAFILAMLSKGSVAILPLVLLGLVAWDRRLRLRDAGWLAPFLVVAAAFTAVNVWFQGHHLGAGEAIRHLGAAERLVEAAAVVWFYLFKALVPLHLVFIYPAWQVQLSDLRWAGGLLAALGLTAWLAGRGWSRAPARRWWRGALFAWGYFCVALLPVMGFTDVYFMKFSLVADHYQHLALIGVTSLAAAGWTAWRPRGLAVAAAVAVLALFAGLTWRQCLRYRDAETLMTATLADNPDSWFVQGNIGQLLGARQQVPEAIAHLEEALRLNPDYPEGHVNLGALLVGQRRFDEGAAQYEIALRLRPTLVVVRLNLGALRLYQGRLDEAREQLAAAVRLKPELADAHALLGAVALREGRTAEAIAEDQAAVRLKPDDPALRAQLLRAQAAAGP
jgi:tetratricopeptide (TPR) repeat protein